MFIVAGYETTSTALGYTIYLLALHPEIQEKVYEEIRNTISKVLYFFKLQTTFLMFRKTRICVFCHFRRTKFLMTQFRNSLTRIWYFMKRFVCFQLPRGKFHNTISIKLFFHYYFFDRVVRRLCMKSCNINGITVPEGMTIAADLLTLHFNEDYWGADAKEFNPNR